MRELFACALFVVGIGCGQRPDHGDESQAVLTIEPPSVELLILNGAAANQDYTATLTFPDGSSEDVTDDTTFSVDSAFGLFQGARASITAGGKTTVFGQRNDKVGTAEITAHVKSVRVDPSLPPTTPDLFGGTEDPARAPLVLYPAEDVVMPRNVGDFETHWVDTSGNDIFEISLTTEFADVRAYVPGGNGNPAAGPMASFSAFLAQEWTSAVGLQPTVHYQVRGVSQANPGPVGAAPVRTVQLTNETLEGGIYYWAAASTTGGEGIYRHDMAKPGQPAEEYLTTNQTVDPSSYPNGRCVACHVLSKDGTKMAITYDGGNSFATLVDVATRARQPDIARWNFATFTPDATQILTVHQGDLKVRSAVDQAELATMDDGGGFVSHPDLSPDGTKLVYVRTPGGADWSFSGGQIYTRTYDQTTRTFGAEVPLVTDGGNNFYPSWSPDGNWILFNRDTGNGSAYDNSNGSLFVVKADGSAPPIALAAANEGNGLTNSWGRWAPFQQTIGVAGEPLFWVTVSSRRDFGVRLVGTRRPQIWMTPFFPNRAAQAADPTISAFRLPFQNIEGNNHIAQWTERVVGTL